jgi:hypothetical protein
MPTKKPERTLKPQHNPHARGTDLARAYEDGWRSCYLRSEEELDHLTEVIAGARMRHENDADPKSRRRAVIDIDTLVQRDLARRA